MLCSYPCLIHIGIILTLFLLGRISTIIRSNWRLQAIDRKWCNLFLANPQNAYGLGCPPSQDASGKWRFSSGFPTKHETILVVTITGKGDNPSYGSQSCSVSNCLGPNVSFSWPWGKTHTIHMVKFVTNFLSLRTSSKNTCVLNSCTPFNHSAGLKVWKHYFATEQEVSYASDVFFCLELNLLAKVMWTLPIFRDLQGRFFRSLIF